MSLQWGRGHVTAERFIDRRHDPTSYPLQWGRGHVTAERYARNRWTDTGKPLQWGRGHVTAESVGVGHRQPVSPERFNGAAVM